MKAVVEIHRKDWATPFRHEVPWLEAAQYSREGKLTAFWRRLPQFQLKKSAISQGFRLAFPDDLGGLPDNGKVNRRLEALQKRLSDHKQCFSDNHLAWIRKQVEDDTSDTNLARMEKHVDEVIKRKQVTERLGRVRVEARETEALQNREPAPIF